MLNAWRKATELSAEIKTMRGKKLSFIEKHPWLCGYILTIETIIFILVLIICSINR